MQENENIYETINEMLGSVPGDFKILEEEIDIDLQMEYFEFSRNYVQDKSEEEILGVKDDIFLENTSEEEKKSRFVELASIDNVEAYRTIEKYVKSPGHIQLHDWAVLAYQESRMLLESRLLDQSQVFISTGLGGKGTKLRYFIVFFTRQHDFTKLQKEVLTKELDFVLYSSKSEIEELKFHGRFATLLAIIPLQISIKKLFEKVIRECNMYGDFINPSFIITNVKRLAFDEIEQLLINGFEE